MKRIYIQVSEAFKNAHANDARLNPVKANDGNYYVDQNCIETAPELFTGDEMVKIMDEDDFPKTELPFLTANN